MADPNTGEGTDDIYDIIEFNISTLKYNYYSLCLIVTRFSGALWTLFALGIVLVCIYFYNKLNRIKKVPRDDSRKSPSFRPTSQRDENIQRSESLRRSPSRH